jgi:hypothetical protein
MTKAEFKPASLDELHERRIAAIRRAEQVVDTDLISPFTMTFGDIR